jgi:hypothetical protein
MNTKLWQDNTAHLELPATTPILIFAESAEKLFDLHLPGGISFTIDQGAVLSAMMLYKVLGRPRQLEFCLGSGDEDRFTSRPNMAENFICEFRAG